MVKEEVKAGNISPSAFLIKQELMGTSSKSSNIYKDSLLLGEEIKNVIAELIFYLKDKLSDEQRSIFSITQGGNWEAGSISLGNVVSVSADIWNENEWNLTSITKDNNVWNAQILLLVGDNCNMFLKSETADVNVSISFGLNKSPLQTLTKALRNGVLNIHPFGIKIDKSLVFEHKLNDGVQSYIVDGEPITIKLN